MGKQIGVGKRHGQFLFVMYLFVKCLYVANAIGLLFLLNLFLGKCQVMPRGFTFPSLPYMT